MSTNDHEAMGRFFHQVRTDKQVKLRFGVNKRSELKVALEAGESPEHYRLKWLSATREALVRWLSDQAKEFNATYSHDSCSVGDLVDVTASTLLWLQKVNNSKD